MLRTRCIPALLAGLILFTVAGCRDDEIRHYRVPRSDPPTPRMLAAILPTPEKVWFIKMTGPADAVAAHKDEFDQFVKSVRIPGPGGEPILWTEPPAWRHGLNKDKMRYATFRVGPEALELIVSWLPPRGGDVLANVNRWRGQIHLPDITAAELPTMTKTMDVNGVRATLVDMTGGSASARPRATPAAPVAAAKPLTYDVPPGWTELPVQPGGFRVAAFRVTQGSHSADVTVIPFPGPAGGLVLNVNRWRKELELPDATEEQIKEDAKSLDAGDVAGTYVDLSSKGERTLGVILSKGDRTWFIKFRGPAQLVGQQQAAFEAFVRSVRFGAGG
jgi:hypothetical protein